MMSSQASPKSTHIQLSRSCNCSLSIVSYVVSGEADACSFPASALPSSIPAHPSIRNEGMSQIRRIEMIITERENSS